MDDSADGRSDLVDDESQVSQLLRNVLDGDTDSSRKLNDHQHSLSDSLISKDFSPPSSTRESNSAPQYHFHGLAATQTQTHYDEDAPEQQGSQKENIDAPPGGQRNIGFPTDPNPASSYALPLRHASKPSHNEHSHLSPPRATSAKVKSRTVSFQSPNVPRINMAASSTKFSSGPSTPRHRASTDFRDEDFSQDSFGGPASQDLERQFLARSKQFQVPLSELGRVSEVGERTPSSMFGYSPQPRNGVRVSSSPPARILVDATPSNSGSSQSQPPDPQSQNLNAFSRPQPTEVFLEDAPIPDIDTHSQASSSSSMSSGYVRFVNGEASTQLVIPYESTQPSTDPEDDMRGSGHAWNGAHPTENTTINIYGRQQWPAGAPSASSNNTTNSGVRQNNLLNLIGGKHWKMGRYLQAAAEGIGSTRHPPTAQSTGSEQQRAGMQETQPSLDDETTGPSRGFPLHFRQPMNADVQAEGPSRLHEFNQIQETQPSNDNEDVPVMAGPSRGFPPRHPIRSDEQSKLPKSHLREVDQQGGMGNDTLDFVPDSEPPQVATTPSISARPDGSGESPLKSRMTAKSPAKKPTRYVSPESDANHDSGEIIPDSMDVDEDKEPPKESKRYILTEDDEEDDIPLAITTAKPVVSNTTSRKGKGRALTPEELSDDLEMPPPSIPKATRNKLSAAVKDRQKQVAVHSKADGIANTTVRDVRRTRAPVPKKKAVIGQSWETGIVPSSVPDQDAKTIGLKSSKANSKGGSRAKGTKPTPVSKSNRTKPSPRPSAVGKRRRIASYKEDSDSEPWTQSESEDELLIPKPEAEDEDDGTEPADENYSDSEFQAESGPPSRKRKRETSNVNSKSSKIDSKVLAKVGRIPVVTPSGRQAKRLRSVVSANESRGDVGPPTRVFALWKQDGHYYSGVVHSHQAHGRFLVKFDDNTENTVNVDQMRTCELHIGDAVLSTRKPRTAKVIDISKFDSKDIVTLEADGSPYTVELHEIRIASKTVTYAWRDRMLTPESIVTAIKPPKSLHSLSPSKTSVLSSTSQNSRGHLFGKTGFVVTLSVGNDNWEKDKDRLMLAIKNNGGTVIEDWWTIFHMEGKHNLSNKRWVIQSDEVKWNGKGSIERVFLLADDANQKPKYLTALALGIPCISINWLYDSIGAGEEKDWMVYMLPQGFSEALDARVSQFVDLDWGNSIHHLTDIMSNACASNIFADQSILCVGSDFLPLPKTRRGASDEKSKEATRTVPRIILSMGSRRVEAVADLKSASAKPTTFNYVVIKDEDAYISGLDGSVIVDWAWVKLCLIAGRRLPLPVFPS